MVRYEVLVVVAAVAVVVIVVVAVVVVVVVVVNTDFSFPKFVSHWCPCGQPHH